MSRIDKNIIDRILDAAKIEDVVGDFVTLRKKGVRYQGLCPFHDDRHLGSFVVLPLRIRNNKEEGNCYKCFACGAKGGVVDFLMEHQKLSYPDAIRWLGKKYNIDTDMQDFNYTPPPPRPAPPPLPTLELPKYLMAGTETDTARKDDNLIRWIKEGIAWDAYQRANIEKVLGEYHVGHGKNGHTIFWQIDDQGHLRTGKMMKYRTDGHRDKQASWNFDFIHATLSRKKNEEDSWPFPKLYNPDEQEAQLTFFGMHLLDRYPNATVNIVESEKTAVLMAIAYGNHAKQVWMACGGLEMITRERLQPIIDRGRRIILYPDRDGIEKWKVKAEQMHYKNMVLDCIPVQKWWKPEDGEKADIADVVIRIINNSTELKTIDQVRKEMPNAKPLIDKFNLEISNGKKENT